MKETLLIVEDNPITLEGLYDILSADGYTVFKAADGLEALERLQLLTPDLIVSDIAMPRMDGLNFLKSVRSHPEWLAIPFIFLTARGELPDKLQGINHGVEDYLVKPLKRDELLTAVRARLDRSQQIKMVQVKRAYESSLTLLADAIDRRDIYAQKHVERVTTYTMLLGKELGLQGRSLENLRFGAILHDIGKIIIRESLLLKAGPLSEDEWKELREHPVTGAEMIRKIDYLSPIMPIVRHHHERWDGKGYPEGLAGDAIPLGARIVALADSLDAMTVIMPYRAAMSMDEAYQEIKRCSGTQFDPGVTAAFESLWAARKIQAVLLA